MLYEVITAKSEPSITKTKPIAASKSIISLMCRLHPSYILKIHYQEKDVITSYSIHYTKLYEYTPDIIVGAYVGFDEPQTLGDKETGSRVALPIVREFMQKALKDVLV